MNLSSVTGWQVHFNLLKIMNKKIIILLLLSAFIERISAQVFNIKDYGEINDTNKVCTNIIQKAVDACYKAGGGQVVLPAGLYKSGTIVLKDNVELHFSSGAQLIASKNPDDFINFPPTSYRSQKDEGGWVSLIYADRAQNISLTGSGIIDGRGAGRRGTVKNVAGDNNGRPRNILFISCKKVTVKDITMRNSGLWNQHYLNCEDILVSGIRVWNHCNGNNDGIDIDGCRRFVLSNSIIDSDDDGIVLKSTGTAPCENVLITGCVVSSYANAIKLGTESTGGYRNISISNCIVKPSENRGKRIIKSTPTGITAISLEQVDGGIMDGVKVDNILIQGTECPLYVRLGNRRRKHIKDAPEPPLSIMRNISISNITAYNVGNFGSSITGVPESKIENISISNISVINKGGLKKGSYRSVNDKVDRHDAGGKLFFNQYWKSADEVVEDAEGYPQPTVWGNLPSYGLFIRHVKELTVNNLRFSSEKSDPRKPVILVDVDKYIGTYK